MGTVSCLLLLLLTLASHVVAFQTIQVAHRNVVPRSICSAQTDDFDDFEHDLDNNDERTSGGPNNFSMDPDDPEGDRLLDRLGITSESQRKQLKSLAELVVEWNERINLVSRKDCSVPVVYGRHVLPCLATLGVEDPALIQPGMLVADVGTGGGFPGLPLAITHPETEFLLVDSVGKKLGAVQDMADRLGLTNVRTHHGRVEYWTEQHKTVDVVIGRSVTAIPRYCLWTQRLLKPDGLLLYMIGGEIEEELLEQAEFEVGIDELLDSDGISDKRLLAFSTETVASIAADSGEKVKIPNKPSNKPKPKRKKKVRGEWTKRDPTVPKQRGYENFKRYDTLPQ